MTAPRYLGVIGESPSERHPDLGTTPADLTLAIDRTRLRLWTSNDVFKIGDCGAIVGHLFSRSMPFRRVFSFNAGEREKIYRSKGASLLKDFWGGYVAFFEFDGGDCRVIRDPSGTLPSYWTRTNGNVVVAAEVGDYPSQVRARLRVDPDALAVHLWDLHYSGVQTCLAGVNELLPGNAFRLDRDSLGTRTLWSPWDYVGTQKHVSATEPQVLRHIVIETVRAWASCFSTIVIGMSGGLDSSIICSAIDRSATSTRGLNMTWPDREGDERAFAQQAADAFDLPLSVFQYHINEIDIAAAVVGNVPRPFLAPYIQATAQAQDAMAARIPVAAYFSGEGGDNLFCLMQSVTPIIDRLHMRAKPRALIGTIRDVAALTGGDLTTIAQYTLSRLFARRSIRPPVGDDTFLAPARLRRALDRVVPHPWLETPPATLPGAAAHVRAIGRALGNDGCHSRRTHPPTISPLLAQPIVELCLGIPSWEWVRGGVDRSVARLAFASDLPGSIIRRRSKGGPSGFLDHLYWENEAKIFKLLQSGFLAAHRILDDSPAQAAYGQNRVIAAAQPRRLLSLAAAESWARSWA